MARVAGVGWIAWRSDDAPGVVQFWEEVLGVSLVEMGDGLYWAGKLADGTLVEVFASDGGRNSHMGHGAAVGFVVPDVAAAAETLRAQGVEILLEPQMGEAGTSWAHFRGPDGNVYQLMNAQG